MPRAGNSLMKRRTSRWGISKQRTRTPASCSAALRVCNHLHVAIARV
jgi:hypothetical protein